MAHYDSIIIGAGAAGLYCAIQAGRRGRRVLVLEHNDAAGAKILISGGGRCNFTNIRTAPECFISANPHFARSALTRHGPEHFIALVDRHHIPYYEKTLGQLFSEGARSSAKIFSGRHVERIRSPNQTREPPLPLSSVAPLLC